MNQADGCSIGAIRSRRGALAMLAGTLLIAGAAVAAPAKYRIVALPELPGTQFSVAYGISDAGEIVGYASPTALDDEYAVSWGVAPYALRRLGDPGPPYEAVSATAVNNAGEVVGLAETGVEHVAVMWDPSGQIVELGDLPLGSIVSSATDINSSGLVVGYGTGPDRYRPVVWTGPGAIRPLLLDAQGTRLGGVAWALNDFGGIAGYFQISGSSAHAARWPAGRRRMQDLGDLPGGEDWSTAYGINNAGQIVGFGTSELGLRAVLWNSDGAMTDLGDLIDGQQYAAVDINEAGTVLGHYSRLFTTQGFLWTAGDGMVALVDLIDPADPLRVKFGARHAYLYAINSAGLIVGAMFTGDPANGFIHAIVLVPQE